MNERIRDLAIDRLSIEEELEPLWSHVHTLERFIDEDPVIEAFNAAAVRPNQYREVRRSLLEKLIANHPDDSRTLATAAEILGQAQWGDLCNLAMAHIQSKAESIERAREIMFRHLNYPFDETLRAQSEALAESLLLAGDPIAVDALTAAVHDRETAVRTIAARLLGRLAQQVLANPTPSNNKVLRIISDDDERAAARELVGELRSALLALVEDPDLPDPLRDVVAECLDLVDSLDALLSGAFTTSLELRNAFSKARSIFIRLGGLTKGALVGASVVAGLMSSGLDIHDHIQMAEACSARVEQHLAPVIGPTVEISISQGP